MWHRIMIGPHRLSDFLIWSKQVLDNVIREPSRGCSEHETKNPARRVLQHSIHPFADVFIAGPGRPWH